MGKRQCKINEQRSLWYLNNKKGKTMQNDVGRHLTRIKTLEQEKEIIKILCDEQKYKSHKIITEDIIQIEEQNDEIEFKSPIYIGMQKIKLRFYNT